MSTTTVTTWKCDTCGITADIMGSASYSTIPQGWAIIQVVERGRFDQHACPACVKEKGL